MDIKNEKVSEETCALEVDKFVDSKVENSSNENRRDEKSGFKHLIGVFLGLLSTFSLSMGSIFARKAELFNGSELALTSSIVIFVIISIIIRVQGKSLLGPAENRMILMVRGLLVTFALLSLRISVKLITPSDTIALFHMNVIIVALLARLMFKEMLSFVHIFALIISLIGYY